MQPRRWRIQGMVLHLGLHPLRALTQPPHKCPFREDEAHRLLLHYGEWVVVKQWQYWEIGPDGRPWTGITCHGHNPDDLPDLKFTDLLNPDIFPEKSTAERT